MSRLSLARTTLQVKDKSYVALARYRPRPYCGDMKFIKSENDTYFPGDPHPVWAQFSAYLRSRDRVRKPSGYGYDSLRRPCRRANSLFVRTPMISIGRERSEAERRRNRGRFVPSHDSEGSHEIRDHGHGPE